MPKPEPSPAQRARESVRAKVAAFDADPEKYEGTVDVVDPAQTKEDTTDGDDD